MDAEKRWCCSQCGSLLGLLRSERLHIKIRKLHYIIDGRSTRVTAVCRHCGSVTEICPSTTTETLDVQQAHEAHRRPARKAERNERHVEP